MKKNLMTLMAVLCCAMTTTVFTACSDNSDNPETPPAQPKVVSYKFDYSVEFPKEVTSNSLVCGNLYLLCDKIEVGYIDENGQERREVINNGKWSKSVTYKYKKNLETSLMLYMTKPASIDESSLTYDQYAAIVNIMPTLEGGITTIYVNGKSEKSPYGSFSTFFTKSDSALGPNAYPKKNVPTYFNIAIKSEELVLHIQYRN